MTTRRRFIEILPLAGLGVGLGSLAACGDKAPEAAPAAAPAPMPAVTPGSTPAPAMETPSTPTSPAPADTASLPLVSEQDDLARTLGYVAVAATADRAKYPQYADGQHCGNCALYGVAADVAQGPCPLFPGRHVLNDAWCASWVRRA